MGDVNGDDLDDVFEGTAGNVLLGLGSLTGQLDYFSTAVSGSSTTQVLANLTGDGILDFVLPQHGNQAVMVASGHGNKTAGPAYPYMT